MKTATEAGLCKTFFFLPPRVPLATGLIFWGASTAHSRGMAEAADAVQAVLPQYYLRSFIDQVCIVRAPRPPSLSTKTRESTTLLAC